jgi:uncharacterized protein (TIGR02217 family)
MSFLETPRFPTNIGFGSTGGPTYNTDVIIVSSGQETRNAKWQYPLHNYDVASGVKSEAQLASLISFFHSANGRLHGFRFKDHSDYTSSSAPAVSITATDQNIGTGDGADTTFQLRKQYVNGALTQNRLITKPVSGTTVVAISSVTDTRWTVSTSTGIVTFSANINKSITAISQATSARITTSTNHGLSVGNTVYISSVSGMTQINSLRLTVTNVASVTQFDVNINSLGFSAYTSGGSINTIPQSGEAVTAGFEFDVPVRFDTDRLSVNLQTYGAGNYSVPLVEIRV